MQDNDIDGSGGAASAGVTAPQAVADVLDAAAPIITMLNSIEGRYGFGNSEPVDTRHFGPPYNNFAPLTLGDLRTLVAALRAAATSARQGETK